MDSVIFVKNFYGMKVAQSKRTKDYYNAQREKCIKTLGNKYCLANPVKRIK